MNDDELTLTLLRKIETLENRIEYLEAVEKNFFSKVNIRNRVWQELIYKNDEALDTTAAFTITFPGTTTWRAHYVELRIIYNAYDSNDPDGGMARYLVVNETDTAAAATDLTHDLNGCTEAVTPAGNDITFTITDSGAANIRYIAIFITIVSEYGSTYTISAIT